MADLRIDEASQEALKARACESGWGGCAGKAGTDHRSGVYRKSSARHRLAPGYTRGDGCPARGVADIVDAFLFRRAPTPAKNKG
jgi:hypothetical protein